ncbi:hypothetical protein X777_04115 [Ooceraea biroi]|uniref:Uncharacterized protein n=1 Tax=Ooceraea biroi TaxID=2015173 RepID=A0A026WJQ0_OOCBI|nr:hypothetical protein X777_04115 [Ooceraea biroi]
MVPVPFYRTVNTTRCKTWSLRTSGDREVDRVGGYKVHRRGTSDILLELAGMIATEGRYA